MKAARLHRWAEPPVVEEVDDPEPAEGETLVRVVAGAVGHLDRTVGSGHFLTPPELPYVPGVEGAGHVVRSTTLAEGTPVWLRGGGLGLGRDGTWAELVAAPDEAVTEAPGEVDLTLAACFFSPATSAWTAVHEIARVAAGQRVGVTGAAGAVGSLAVQLAARAGAHVVGVVSRQERAVDVPPGAQVVVGRGADAAAALSEGGGVDVVVDTVGGQGLAELVHAVRPGGCIVAVGYTAGTGVTLDLPTLLQRDVRLLPLNMIRRAPAARRVAADLLERLGAGDLSLAVTALPLDRAADAVELLASGRAHGRVVLVP